MAILRLIANSLAPLTVAAALGAYAFPPLFLIFQNVFLWFFGLTMLALGVVLEPQEFKQTLTKPRAIALGVLTQFSVMSSLGFAVAYFGGFDPDTALGFIIVGSAPGAMASNLIVYLAGGAVAYSVALTTVSTFLSPLFTPLIVKIFGGVFLPIPFWPMMQTILQVVVLPLGLGMLVRARLGATRKVALQLAPAVAVLAITVICGYAVAANQARIATVGPKIFLVVVALNGCGYLLGWYLAVFYRFNYRYRLALMIEIGMQNAGLGVALALQHFSPQTALPGVLFAIWCIVTAAAATAVLRRRAGT